MASHAEDQLSALSIESGEKIIVAIEDEWNVWPSVRQSFEARLPLKKVQVHNRARKPVELDRLPLEYVLTSEPKLRSRPPVKNNPHWFRHPFATLILLACHDPDEYRVSLRARLQALVKAEQGEWLIVHVMRAGPNDPAGKQARKVFARIEDHFRRDRCVRVEVSAAEPNYAEVEAKVVECIRTTLDARMVHYSDAATRLLDQRHSPHWNFCAYYTDKESLALMSEMAQLRDDALRDYDEIEQVYLEAVRRGDSKVREFGGLDVGDERAALLDAGRKPMKMFAHEETIKQFDFRQYLFARRAALLFAMGRPAVVADRAYAFILDFSKELAARQRELPFCMREVWVLSACTLVTTVCAERFAPRSPGHYTEKDFFRLQADLISLARAKLMRLGDLVGFGKSIRVTPCNMAALGLCAWPAPAVWPSAPSDSDPRVKARQAVIQEVQGAGSAAVPRGEARLCGLGPCSLVQEANRRKASLTAGMPGGLWPDASPSRPNDSRPDGSTPPKQRPGSPSSGPGAKMLSLAQVQVAAASALEAFVTSGMLKRALSSREHFEDFYLELTRSAADCYARSLWLRHAVALDAEVGSLHEAGGRFDLALKVYEKQNAAYSAARWHHLLLDLFPRLSHCQLLMRDLPAFLGSCTKLLSLGPALVPLDERSTVQRQMVEVARSRLEEPVSVDVSSLLSFALAPHTPTPSATAAASPSVSAAAPMCPAGRAGSRPLELGEGDVVSLSLAVWSSLPAPLALDSLVLSLVTPPLFTAEDGIRMKSEPAPVVLQPGGNTVQVVAVAKRQGVYVLGMLMAHCGRVRFRSSSATIKGGPPEAEDYLTSERTLRTVLKVSPSRHLLDMAPVVDQPLLLGEPQWLGLLLHPLSYSLAGSLLRLAGGPGLLLPPNQTVECQRLPPACPSALRQPGKDKAGSGEGPEGGSEAVPMVAGSLHLPSWCADCPTVVWVQACAYRDRSPVPLLVPAASSPSSSPTHSQQQQQAGGGDGASSSPSLSSTDWGSSAGSVSSRGGSPSGDSASQHSTATARGGWAAGGEGATRGQAGVGSVPAVRVVRCVVEYGTPRTRVFEKVLTFQFVEPFHVSTRVVSRGADGARMLLQMSLHSNLRCTLRVASASLRLQPGFALLSTAAAAAFATCPAGPSAVSPVAAAPLLDVGPLLSGTLLFTLSLRPPGEAPSAANKTSQRTARAHPASQQQAAEGQGEGEEGRWEGGVEGVSELRVQYEVVGERLHGAHAPVSTPLWARTRGGEGAPMGAGGADDVGGGRRGEQGGQAAVKGEEGRGVSGGVVPVYRHAVVLQMPVTDRVLAVGLLTPASAVSIAPRVGCVLVLEWRIERLIDGLLLPHAHHAPLHLGEGEEVEFEVRVSGDDWMIAGRRKGFVRLPMGRGAKHVLSLHCLPVKSGFVRPPVLRLPQINPDTISHSPAGPHLLRVLPQEPCASFCVSKRV
ncbi:hypothetical protein CLOM_g1978 [Closterium sp. NIES-68]|nr:hypothetical protein CLOM_g1978 [Closterium sp. NIES-68]GJP63526.1 hypothetical protein CLOP_g20593 [Closterium sp. NIES-67]